MARYGEYGVEGPVIGLSTKEALTKLKLAISEELEKEEVRFLSEAFNSFPTWIKVAFHHRSCHSTFAWTSAMIMSFEILMLCVYQAYGSQNYRIKSIAAEIFFLILFLLFNLFIVAWDSRLRHTEMYSKIKAIVNNLQGKIRIVKKGQYSNLHTPQSPCISVQWTYRDGQLVNLPCSLLVEGDVILLRPGHSAPGHCKSLNKKHSLELQLERGQMFAPAKEHLPENFNSPCIRKPAATENFILLETPFLNGIRHALRSSLKRPVSLFSKEYHAVVFYYVERFVIPAAIVLSICIGGVCAAYFDSNTSEWTEHLLLRPVLAVLPLVPISLPTCWILLNAFGNSYLLGMVKSLEHKKPVDPFDEIEEISSPSFEHKLKWEDLKLLFCALLSGKGGYLWRTANLLQVLGSVTTLCCVDKKGILSWPNPTAEKVFFLKSPKSKSNSEESTQSCEDVVDNEHIGDMNCLNEEVLELKRLTKLNRRLDIKDHIYHPGSQVEVLDLTHNVHSPFGIQFDDPNWKFYIGNLKPLGLGILLNTCNPKAQEHYTCFSDHIACESLYNDAAVPVVNKRCLCELAKQIGFSDSVVHFYDLEQQLGIFRHVHPEVVQKGKLARSLNFPRLKMPFPNLSCVVVKDLHRGSYQLFSQGTADLVLDACNEYWDGDDICILTDSDRKRILDFYHRSSLTAHCMGYAYSPLNKSINGIFSDMYIELPAEGYHLFSALKSTTSSPRSWDTPPAMNGCNRQHSLNRYLSSDSLILSEQVEKLEELNSGKTNGLHQLGNEIFIGMVTMQYQACPDFVQLIEHLDKACIRFVHFSKENELRSRVFSEKMGLESGWNCHISLLSNGTGSKNQMDDQTVSPLTFSRHYQFPGILEDSSLVENRNEVPTRHASAPSIINIDTNTLKVEEQSTNSKSENSTSEYNTLSSRHHAEIDGQFLNGDSLLTNKKSVSSVQDIFVIDEVNLSHSPSHITESTDQSAPVTFDMSNRAKLPKGTENIRPHIENVDNVPLQVSLFTDCTAEATREMICIMQEYGEVVCCLGSSANTENMPIFLQADASIGIEPLHPQLCIQQPVFSLASNQKGPSELSCLLNSLPCGLYFQRDEPISLYHLIMEARHFMCSVRNGLQFMLCCCLSISLLQVIAAMFFLPLVLPLAHLLWMICLEIPLLSLSLLGNPVDSKVMMLATGKNLKVANKQAFFFFIACFCTKFCPSVLIAVFSFACIMSSFCNLYLANGNHVCWIFLDLSKSNKRINSSESWVAALTVSQNILSLFLILCFVLVSMSFVHRSQLLWKSNVFANKFWFITSIFVICLQIIFSITDVCIHVDNREEPLQKLNEIPYYVWLLFGLWPFFVVPLNELVKRHEIKVNVRQQKRARLEFCTKLGMNSPF
ncbi:transmembrane protein 94-like [Uloborus diversus]|uniref:transmembrane protein 94-like n=1 Tax=Uloborus diversus TaxID=327109 RepID=UPI00240A311C|nr:transmembrane protein 94-like [Uloborus diversus]